MKRFLVASTFTCLLTVSALAGEISTSGAPSPAPDGTTQKSGWNSSGQTRSDGIAADVSDATLSAVLAVLSLLS